MSGDLDGTNVVGGKWIVAAVLLTAGCSLFGSPKQYDDDDDNGGQSASGGSTLFAGRGGSKSASTRRAGIRRRATPTT